MLYRCHHLHLRHALATRIVPPAAGSCHWHRCSATAGTAQCMRGRGCVSGWLMPFSKKDDDAPTGSRGGRRARALRGRAEAAPPRPGGGGGGRQEAAHLVHRLQCSRAACAPCSLEASEGEDMHMEMIDSVISHMF